LILLILSFSAICASILWQMGGRDYLPAKQAATNLVASISSEIARNIEPYSLSLPAVVDGIKLPEINAISCGAAPGRAVRPHFSGS
jgi:hypothetical protein